MAESTPGGLSLSSCARGGVEDQGEVGSSSGVAAIKINSNIPTFFSAFRIIKTYSDSQVAPIYQSLITSRVFWTIYA